MFYQICHTPGMAKKGLMAMVSLCDSFWPNMKHLIRESSYVVLCLAMIGALAHLRNVAHLAEDMGMQRDFAMDCLEWGSHLRGLPNQHIHKL